MPDLYIFLTLPMQLAHLQGQLLVHTHTLPQQLTMMQF